MTDATTPADALVEVTLKPCPFCGHSDLLGIERVPPPIRLGFLHVRCRTCGCISGGRGGDTEAEAIAWWNRRAPFADQRSDHDLGPCATVLGDGDDNGFATLAVLHGQVVYIKQAGSLIVMTPDVAARVAAVIASATERAGTKHEDHLADAGKAIAADRAGGESALRKALEALCKPNSEWRGDEYENARAALASPAAPECRNKWPDPVLVEHKVDDECGCPEEIWEAYGAHLFMHLRAGGRSDGHADYGDDGEREMTTTGATHDDARAAIFGWARGIADGLPPALLAARSLSGEG